MTTYLLDPVMLAAETQLKELAVKTSSYPEEVQTTIATVGLALVALLAPRAQVGACSIDGSELNFDGRSDGLYVCCGGEEQHCWKVGL